MLTFLCVVQLSGGIVFTVYENIIRIIGRRDPMTG